MCRQAFLAGTFFPAFRAFDKPMAIACFLLVTFFPLRPLLSCPFFLSLISVATSLLADLEYLRAELFFVVDFFVPAFLIAIDRILRIRQMVQGQHPLYVNRSPIPVRSPVTQDPADRSLRMRGRPG